MLAATLKLGLLGLLAAPPVTGPRPEPTPIVGGTTVEPGTWPEVAAILLPLTICSATLVSDRVLITAAHCLEGGEPPAVLTVRFGDDIYGPHTDYAVERYGTHPMYCGSDPEVCRVDVWDFAYVVLSEPVVGVTPARPLVTQAAWDEAMVAGAPVTLVGFGESEKPLGGIKREVEAPIVKFSPSGLEFQAGGMGLDTCRGDSGGPAFVTTAAGETLLAGVTSRGFNECGKGGFYGTPYTMLCWLHSETGVDLRGAEACEACDCLDTRADRDEGCGCVGGEPAGGPLGPLLLGVVVVLGLRARRRRA